MLFLEDGHEQILFVPKVMIEGTASNAGAADDVLGGGFGVSVFGEEVSGDADECDTRSVRIARLAVPEDHIS
jgi:hypothetical protein